jgi:hypothetical protein
MGKLIYEQTMFKILIEKTGIIFSVTMKRRAYFFFVSTKLFGIRIAPTTDPDPGIVEICGYDIPAIVDNWEELANVRLKTRIRVR